MNRQTPGQLVFEYVNYKGEKSTRNAMPRFLWFGNTKWHPEPQWFMRAFCNDRRETRDFALKDCKFDEELLI